MVDAVWPVSTVPHRPEYSGYRSALAPSGSSFQPDTGPPSTWRRTTLQSRKIQASFVWTTAQRDAFYDFYYDDLAGGTLPFEWDNPAFSVTGRYLFDPDNQPTEEAIGYDSWRVTISVLRMRDA